MVSSTDPLLAPSSIGDREPLFTLWPNAIARIRPGPQLDCDPTLKIQQTIARGAGSTHVPGRIIAVDALPTTFSGKHSERSARDALNGRAIANLGAVIDPECLAPLQDHVAEVTSAAQQPRHSACGCKGIS